ncbi:MAG: hypothetical protein GX455_13535, partial [Phycisphaerae bacterium]|nr:hypothetical protein [Phycisphaerae bacterium]
GVRRYIVRETFGPAEQLTPIPGSVLYDPAGLALRNPAELFIANRAAHTGKSSIARVSLFGSNFSYIDSFSGNGVTDCHQLNFDPVSGELFQTNWSSGVLSRFLFDASGNPVPNGTILMPDSGKQLGVVVRPADRQLFVSDYTKVRRFMPNPDGSYTFLGYFAINNSTQYHFMKVKDDLLYLTSFSENAVIRFSFDAQGNPTEKDRIVASNALDMDFSPDGQEMFVTDHGNGGIMRFRYDSITETWIRNGDDIPTPMLGGIVIVPTACPLSADLTGECIVDLEDLRIFASQWLVPGDDYYCMMGGNLVGDKCLVTLEDFAEFVAQWMMKYPPDE